MYQNYQQPGVPSAGLTHSKVNQSHMPQYHPQMIMAVPVTIDFNFTHL